MPEIAVPTPLFRMRNSLIVFDKHVQDIFGPMLDNKGLVLICVGLANLFSHGPSCDKRCCWRENAPAADTGGDLLRKRAGGSGVPMGVVDMVPALKTGQVKALQTSTVYGIAIGLHKLAPNVTYAQISHDIGTITVSKKTWKKLNEKQSGALRLMANYVDELRKGIRGAEQALLGKIEKAGINVIRPAGEDAASWRSYAAAAQQDLVEGIGPTAKPIWDRWLRQESLWRRLIPDEVRANTGRGSDSIVGRYHGRFGVYLYGPADSRDGAQRTRNL